jgi:predicted helicase
VSKYLLPRLHGYELMMAPYAIAHLKIGLKLFETGYRFDSDERARVYLTNALEQAHDHSGTFQFAIPALAHEADAVNTIKQGQRFTVVLGNPPYSVKTANRGEWISDAVTVYKSGMNEKKLNLDDDFIKFIRFAEIQSEAAGFSVVGMITHNIFLSGVTHRKMRRHLL